MIKLIIYFLITLFLDNILSNFFVFSLFNVCYLIIIYFFLSENHFLIFSVFLGFIYDLIYLNYPINIFLFLIIGILIIIFYKKFKYNLFNTIIITIIMIIIYNFSLYLVFINNFTIYNLIYRIINSILVNIFYIIFSYLIFNMYKKSDYINKNNKMRTYN